MQEGGANASQDSRDTRLFPVRSGPGTAEFGTLSVPTVEGYQIVGPLGRGGMGTVWRAKQLSTHREVALKLMALEHFGSDRARRRFDREVQLTARLQHPNIARLYDSGIHAGVYFYAMELVEGDSLDQYVKQHALSVRALMQIFREIARAVQHAHQRGIIHRDLKPSNIMIDHEGHTRILDFGLAKSFGNAEERSEISIAGEMAGTPAFMSPEQAAGHFEELDTRTDVYSLGVIFYRLLTGHPPHELSGGQVQICRRIIEDEPQNPRRFNPALERDLCAMLLKALAKTPDARYSTAGELAEDIDRFLSGEALAAAEPTILYFLVKRFRKHRIRFMAIGGLMVLVAAILVDSSMRIRKERDTVKGKVQELIISQDAEKAARQATELRLAAHELFAGSELVRAGEDSRAESKLWQAYNRYLRNGNSGFSALVTLADLYGSSSPPLRRLNGLKRRIIAVGAVPATSSIVAVDRSATVLAWDLTSPTPPRTIRKASGVAICASVNAADSRLMLVVQTENKSGAGGPFQLEIWDLRRGELQASQVIDAIPSTNFTVSADGKWGAFAVREEQRSTIHIFNTVTAQRLSTATCGISNAVALSFLDDNLTLVCAGSDGVSLVGPKNGDARGAIQRVGFKIQSLTEMIRPYSVVACSDIGELVELDFTHPTVSVRRIETHQSRSNCISGAIFDGDMKLGVGGSDGALTLIGKDGQTSRRYLVTGSPICNVSMTAAQMLLAGTMEGQVYVCDTRIQSPSQVNLIESPLCAASSSNSNAPLFAAGNTRGSLFLCDFLTGKLLTEFPVHRATIRAVALDRTLSHVYSADINGNVRITNLADGVSCSFASGLDFLSGAVFAGDRASCLCWGPAGIREVVLLAGKSTHIQSSPVRCADYLGESKDFFVADVDGGLTVMRRTQGNTHYLISEKSLEGAVSYAGGKRLFCGDSGGTVRVLDLKTGIVEWSTPGHRREICAVAISADETAGLTCSTDGVAKLWDLSSGLQLHEMKSLGQLRQIAIAAGDLGLIGCGGNHKSMTLLDNFGALATARAAQLPTLVASTSPDRGLRSNLLDAFAAEGRWEYATPLWNPADNPPLDKPLHAAALAWCAGKNDIAIKCYQMALARTKDPAEIAYLKLCISTCSTQK